LPYPIKNRDTGTIDQRHDSVTDCVECFLNLAAGAMIWLEKLDHDPTRRLDVR